MAKGRFTFPVAILICLLLRIITGNEWQDVINLLVCALTAYLLIEINTAFTLIRTRSTLHVSFYVFLSTACLFLHSFQYAVFAPLTFLIAISQLFSSYESPYPAAISMTDAPIVWISAGNRNRPSIQTGPTASPVICMTGGMEKRRRQREPYGKYPVAGSA